MNNDDKNIKIENEASGVSNLNTPVLSFSGPLSPHLVEKRTLPLLYVQSAPASKNNVCNTHSSSSFGNSEPICETSGHFNIPKLSASTALPSNGATKFVQVQSPNQNIAYVGTLFKQSTKGKDVIPQKVLLTPVKGKDVPMARLILPRPPNTPQNNISPVSKQVCRSFVVSPVSQNTLVTSAITVQASEGPGKIIQPSIIRQKNVENKVISSGSLMPGGIIVPAKTPGPPPALTVLKSNTIQPQNLEKPGMKVVLLDMKEQEMQKEPTQLSSESGLLPKNSDSPAKLPLDKSNEKAFQAKQFHENVIVEETDNMNFSSPHKIDFHKTTLGTVKTEKLKNKITKREQSSACQPMKPKANCVGLSMPLLDADPPFISSQGEHHLSRESTVESLGFISPSTDPSKKNSKHASSSILTLNTNPCTIVDNVVKADSSGTEISNNSLNSLISCSSKNDAVSTNIFAIRTTNHCNVVGANASSNTVLNTFPITAPSIQSPNSYAVPVSANSVENTPFQSFVSTSTSATFKAVSTPNTLLVSSIPCSVSSCTITINSGPPINISPASSCSETKSLINKCVNASPSPSESPAATLVMASSSSHISKISNVSSNRITPNNSTSNSRTVLSSSFVMSASLPGKTTNPSSSPCSKSTNRSISTTIDKPSLSSVSTNNKTLLSSSCTNSSNRASPANIDFATLSSVSTNKKAPSSSCPNSTIRSLSTNIDIPTLTSVITNTKTSSSNSYTTSTNRSLTTNIDKPSLSSLSSNNKTLSSSSSITSTTQSLPINNDKLSNSSVSSNNKTLSSSSCSSTFSNNQSLSTNNDKPSLSSNNKTLSSSSSTTSKNQSLPTNNDKLSQNSNNKTLSSSSFSSTTSTNQPLSTNNDKLSLSSVNSNNKTLSSSSSNTTTTNQSLSTNNNKPSLSSNNKTLSASSSTTSTNQSLPTNNDKPSLSSNNKTLSSSSSTSSTNQSLPTNNDKPSLGSNNKTLSSSLSITSTNHSLPTNNDKPSLSSNNKTLPSSSSTTSTNQSLPTNNDKPSLSSSNKTLSSSSSTTSTNQSLPTNNDKPSLSSSNKTLSSSSSTTSTNQSLPTNNDKPSLSSSNKTLSSSSSTTSTNQSLPTNNDIPSLSSFSTNNKTPSFASCTLSTNQSLLTKLDNTSLSSVITNNKSPSSSSSCTIPANQSLSTNIGNPALPSVSKNIKTPSSSSCAITGIGSLPMNIDNPSLTSVITSNKKTSSSPCTSSTNQSLSTNIDNPSLSSVITINKTSSSSSSLCTISTNQYLSTDIDNSSFSSVNTNNKAPSYSSSSFSSETTPLIAKSADVAPSIMLDKAAQGIVTVEAVKSVPTNNIPSHIPSSSGERARKRKGSLSASAPSPSKTLVLGDNYENMKLFPGAEEIDPFKVIQWDEKGLGKLPESEIKVVINAFNMIELFDSDKNKGNSENSNNYKKELAEEIYCCVSCGCYGQLTEFFNENYCSISCRDELFAQQYAIVAKKDPEIESSDKDKKKAIPETSSNKKTVLTNENNKNSPKPQVKPVDDDKLYEQDIIEIEESSSTDAENSPKKNSNDDSRANKVKKLPTKVSKLPFKKPEKTSKPLNIQPTNESKSKIKLRPRTAGKISKPLVPTQEKIVQDLDVGDLRANTSNDQSECSKKETFSWATYLAQTKKSSAWVKLFNNAYPNKLNRFKVGHKLEAIDPEHQSYFCLVTVVCTKGYRLKLHFDGYPSEYDFWVNADSPNIFPSEFCISHKIPLHPPPGQASKTFDWNAYLARNNSKAAPSSYFENHISSSDQTNLFKVDMKLEAVDRKNTFLVCVATVAAVMENRILIHFDSWGDLYDYWVDISSPYIRPVGWCKNNNHELTPPNGIKSENFSWKKYLKETKSIAAPEKAFTLRPPVEFKKGMKIEAVDKRAPHLLRVATIAEVLPYQVKISFDGFPPHFGYWVDDDCPDIHPVDWGCKTEHPLEPPPTVEQFEHAKCPTPGCIGQGFLHGTKEETHSEVKNCPYATENLGKDTALTDRLKWTKVKRNGTTNIFEEDSEEESDEDIEGIRWSWLKVKQEEAKSCKEVRREDNANFNDECVGENRFDEPEEIKEKSAPYSPIPKIEETANTVEIKTDNKRLAPKPLQESNNVTNISIKSEINVESALRPVTIKKEYPDNYDFSNSNEAEANLQSRPSTPPPIQVSIKQEIIDLTSPIDEKKGGHVQKRTDNHKNKINEKTLDSLENRNDEKILDLIHASFNDSRKLTKDGNGGNGKLEKPVNGLTGEKTKLEEKNVLFWTIHQVSQFTRPLISCADDCFLKEGIDGPGFLMLSKNDLLDYLGLSDSDAERVFRKISMLRKKCILS